MKRNHASQNGSVFFIILLAIMMFAMLSYAVSQGNRSGASSLTREQLNVAAQEINAFGDTLSKAVQTLKLRGCTNEQISFESMPVAGNENPVSPTNDSCDVFNIMGGKANYMVPPAQWLNLADDGKSGYREWFFTNGTCIPYVGTGGTGCSDDSEMEIVMILPWVREDLCNAYNKYAGWRHYDSTPIPDEADSAYDYSDKVDGVFPSGSDIDTSGELISGERTLCFQGGSSDPAGGYHIYFVLLAR